MSELGPSSFESPEHRHSMDSLGRNADMPFNNYQIYDEGDASYDHLPDYATDLSADELGLFDHEMPGYENGNGSPETKATTEVQRSMAEIETAEQQIADHTGLKGEALADATDQYLTAKVEHQEDFETEDAAHAVEDALIEGALEATGQRPTSEHNPIDELEQDGFDTQVTKGIERLHEQGATLPHGESAAEVVAMVIDSKKPSAERQEMSVELDAAIQAYANGHSKEDLIKAGLDPDMVTEHIRSLPEEEQQYLKEVRQGAKQHERLEETIESNLETTAPELLQGRLPKELADRIGSEYVIGLRQLGDSEAGEAQQKLDTDGGVDVSNLSLTQSFNVIKKGDDQEITKGIVINGYYGAEKGGGKFVIAVPMSETADSPTTAYETIPDMQRELKSNDNPDFRAVNPKYVAGFIDGQGVFHANENFMQSNEARLVGESVDYNKESKEAGWDSPERVQKLVEQYIVPGSKVLDIGTGTGLAVQGYAEKGATVIGLDHDTAMLDQARKVVGENGVLRQADINKLLPISDLDGQVDVVQAVGVLEFASNLEGVIAQANISQKKGGVFAFTTEALAKVGPQSEIISPYPEAGVTVHRHSVAEITKMLHDSGYELVSHDRYDAYERAGGAVKYNMFLARKV